MCFLPIPTPKKRPIFTPFLPQIYTEFTQFSGLPPFFGSLARRPASGPVRCVCSLWRLCALCGPSVPLWYTIPPNQADALRGILARFKRHIKKPQHKRPRRKKKSPRITPAAFCYLLAAAIIINTGKNRIYKSIIFSPPRSGGGKQRPGLLVPALATSHTVRSVPR